MILTFSIITFLIATFFLLKLLLRKYQKPLYQFRGEYSYTYHGKNKEYYTEALRYPSASKDHSIVFLFLAGNPGNVRFYDRFLYHLNEIYNKKYEFIGIGQAGQFNKSGKFEKYFNLEEQVDHKIQYFRDLINQDKYKHSKFVFIGHSFGCYTALKLINNIDPSRIIHAIMIHPAFDRLLQTPNGQHRNGLHKYNLQFKVLLKLIDWFVPISVLRWISLKNFEKDKYKEGEDINDCAEALAEWISYDTVTSFFHLTRYQFAEINDMNEEEIKKFSNKITAYYAKNDDWTPEYQKQDFKLKFSDHAEYYEDELGLDHTFVAGGSRVKAQVIQKLLKGKIQ